MQVASIVLARTLAYIERFDLDPTGKVSIADIIKGIGERYKFQILPKQEEWQKEGLTFEDGKIGNKVVQKLSIYNLVIVLETRSNTSDSKALIEDLLEWGAAKFGLNYKPGSIKKFAYVSDVTFHSEIALLDMASSPLSDLAAKVSTAISEIWKEAIKYQPSSISAGHDPQTRQHTIAPFSISRRLETAFSENKYFSEAPLPTDIHIQLLEQFERDVKAWGKVQIV